MTGSMGTGPGRRTLYRPELCAEARDHCRQGATLSQLAGLLGVAPRSIDNWIARIPEFAAAVCEGRAAAAAEVDRMLYERAVGYKQTVERVVLCRGRPEIVRYTRHHRPDASACMRWLCRNMPQDWRSRRGLASKRSLEDSGMNRAHQFSSAAAEVVSSLHALTLGYAQLVERVMVCHGKPLVVSDIRQHRRHIGA